MLETRFEGTTIDARSILDNLLDASQKATTAGSQLAQDKGLLPSDADERAAVLKGMGQGALAAGAIAMLLGSKRGRKFSKKALKVGGAAAIGGLAYRAFNEWQAQQNTASPGHAGGDIGTPINELASSAADERSEAIVKAMISAARADGHLDDLEQAHISQKIEELGLQIDVTQFLMAELAQAVDARRIAALADSPEAAAEMYLASALIIDQDSKQERQYLSALANAMELSSEMTERLEGSVGSA